MIRMHQIEGTETILVVDDNDDARRAMCRTLVYHGYTALQATSGAEAIEILEKNGDGVALALIDIVMPGMSGTSLGRKIAERHPDTRMLFTSGYADEGILDPEWAEGRVHFLEKPMTISQLSVKIRTVLDGGRDRCSRPDGGPRAGR